MYKCFWILGIFLTQGTFNAVREAPKYMKVYLQHRALFFLADQFNQSQSLVHLTLSHSISSAQQKLISQPHTIFYWTF